MIVTPPLVNRNVEAPAEDCGDERNFREKEEP